MSYSLDARRITTLEFNLEELSSILSTTASNILGPPDRGFDRKVDIKPVFNVEHGEAILRSIRVSIVDTLHDERSI